MRVRRCAVVFVEPRESLGFDLARLLSGSTGLTHAREWVALAAHLDDELVVDEAEVAVLGRISPDEWVPLENLQATQGTALIDHLLAIGLLVADSDANTGMRGNDEAVRRGHWRALSAVHHRHTRWRGIDTLEAERRFGRETDRSLLEQLGAPDVPVREHCLPAERIALDRGRDTPLEDLARLRITCRNYERGRAVPLADFAQTMFRSFGARAVSDLPGITVMKRATPSAGGLHSTEAYLLVQNVEGIAPGLYHYHPIDHALEPLRVLDGGDTTALALSLVAGQRHFMDAQVIVVLAARFRRTFWKYRNHAKSYRAVVLDAGHLSQMLYLAATERGLAAFITAAVNEADIEQAFGLDPMHEGVVAVCGFGWRGTTVDEIEFDPLAAVWPAGTMEALSPADDHASAADRA